METFPVDIEARQIVRWLQEEKRHGRLPVEVRATRSYETGKTDPPIDDIGGDAADPLAVVTAVGTLEVTPPPGRNGWVLRVCVEDTAGDRLPEDEPVPEGEEEIDLETFNSEFVAPDHGTTFISVDVEDSSAMARFEELFLSLLKNVHAK